MELASSAKIDVLLLPKEVAEIFRVKPDTLRRKPCQYGMAKIGGHWRGIPEAIKVIIEEKKHVCLQNKRREVLGVQVQAQGRMGSQGRSQDQKSCTGSLRRKERRVKEARQARRSSTLEMLYLPQRRE